MECLEHIPDQQYLESILLFQTVFVDVEEGTYNITASEVADAVTEKTKAIMIAHTLGNPFDVDKIVKISRELGLYLIGIIAMH